MSIIVFCVYFGLESAKTAYGMDSWLTLNLEIHSGHSLTLSLEKKRRNKVL